MMPVRRSNQTWLPSIFNVIITPEPGYTVICGFDTPDDTDWGETLWVWGEKG